MPNRMSEQEILRMIQSLDLRPAPAGEDPRPPAAKAGDSGGEAPRDGRIVLKDDKIYAADPLVGGRNAVIAARPPLKLFVDGREIRGETAVASDNAIEWRIEEKPLYEIEVSEDKLTAYFRIHQPARYAWRPVAEQEGGRTVLSAEKDESVVLERIRLTDILREIAGRRLVKNVNLDAIHAEVRRPTYEPVAFARGEPPVPGKDATLELFFNEDIENRYVEVEGRVDYRNHMSIPSASKGKAIALKTPPVEGTAGYDVHGNVLLPAPVRDIPIVGGGHVEILPDGRVIALKDGRPRVRGREVRHLDIATEHVVNGNVDLTTGNIVFAGDVLVRGDVTDNMIIESLGSIYVSGSVYNATLTATGSIEVHGNVLHSRLYSGYFGVLFNRLYNSTQQLMASLEAMIAGARTVMDSIGGKNVTVRYGQVVQLLLESKFGHVPALLKEMLGVVSSVQMISKGEMTQLRSCLELMQQPVRIVEQMTEVQLLNFLRILRETYQKVEFSQESTVLIALNQCDGSELKSHGDILVRRKGVLQSELHSTNSIVFESEHAVCRGSKLEAGDSIRAMVVGGETGVRTTLKAANRITVRKMYEGRVCIGRRCVELWEPVGESVFDDAYMDGREQAGQTN